MLSWGALKVHCCDRRKVPSNNGIIEEYVKVTKESSLLLIVKERYFPVTVIKKYPLELVRRKKVASTLLYGY